jgi:hypothetical protein
MNEGRIEPEMEYKPKDIANHGWILNSKGKPDYNYVLKLIRRGLLKARIWTSTVEGTDYFLVKGAWIIDYKKNVNNPKS